MKYIIILFLLLLIMITICCSNIKDKQSNTTNKKKSMALTIDSTAIKLIVKRGAFHYDKFVLRDTTITFYPANERLGNEEEHALYNTISEQKIAKKERNQFIKKILNDGFFDLKDSYQSKTSCNSMLTVSISFNNKSKKVVCDDFIRSCPTLLKFIEQEIIRLHNQKLKRIFLPG